MTDKETYSMALKIYGKESQVRMCIEEMAELTKELCKNLRYGENQNAIAEEIADVQITIEQMIMLFGISKEVETMKAGKVKRLEERLMK